MVQLSAQLIPTPCRSGGSIRRWIAVLLAIGLLGLTAAQAQINIAALEASAAGGDVEAQNALGNAYVNG